MRHADLAVVVANPEVSSVRDSDRIIGLLDSTTDKGKCGEPMEKYLLLTRYEQSRAAERGEMLCIEDVLGFCIPCWHRPESKDVLQASNMGLPVTLNNPASAPARALDDAARKLQGEQVPLVVRATGPRCSASYRAEGGMKFADLFAQRSATTAHHRLQVLLMHERCGGNTDLIPILREDILAAINKHVAVDPDKVRLKIDRGVMVSCLSIVLRSRPS